MGTEYLFGAVRCAALTEMLGRGRAIISDEREGLNPKDPFVAAFSQAVSQMIAGSVQHEKEKLTHLERATTSGRTAEMIEQLLKHMSEAAVVDLGLETAPVAGTGMARRRPGNNPRPCGSPLPSITGRPAIHSTLRCCWIRRSCPTAGCSPLRWSSPAGCGSTRNRSRPPSPRWGARVGLSGP